MREADGPFGLAQVCQEISDCLDHARNRDGSNGSIFAQQGRTLTDQHPDEGYAQDRICRDDPRALPPSSPMDEQAILNGTLVNNVLELTTARYDMRCVKVFDWFQCHQLVPNNI